MKKNIRRKTIMPDLTGVFLGFGAWFVLKCIIGGFYTVDQNERAVKTVFGRAVRIPGATTLSSPIAEFLKPEERERYSYPQVRVILAGGPYFKWPWEKIYKVSIATQTVSMAIDPEAPSANQGGTILEAVTKDQLNTGLNGQIRYRIADSNLYAYLFGIKQPFLHVMGYFISILRERIANYQAPAEEGHALISPDSNLVTGVSINDLRKNLRDINEHMDKECLSSAARYGIILDASLITGIDPPVEVESALAAINTAHNQVSSDISLAQASADQKITQSKRAVEIETLKAHAEVEPLMQLAEQLKTLKNSGSDALTTYLRNVKLGLYKSAKQAILEVKK